MSIWKSRNLEFGFWILDFGFWMEQRDQMSKEQGRKQTAMSTTKEQKHLLVNHFPANVLRRIFLQLIY